MAGGFSPAIFFERKTMEEKTDIKAVIGLGNPGPQYRNHRHNIGFHVVDVLAQMYSGQWKEKGSMLYCDVHIDGNSITLIKPQTFMNDSGKVIPFLQKKGVKPEQIIVVHDELEKKFGAVTFRLGGSHRGHNGLRSIIGQCGQDFWRIRFGVGRPENKNEVSAYVLSNFNEEPQELARLTDEAISLIEQLIKPSIE